MSENLEEQVKIHYSKLPKYKLIDFINEIEQKPVKGLNSKPKDKIIDLILKKYSDKIKPIEYFNKFERVKETVNLNKKYGLTKYNNEEIFYYYIYNMQTTKTKQKQQKKKKPQKLLRAN